MKKISILIATWVLLLLMIPQSVFAEYDRSKPGCELAPHTTDVYSLGCAGQIVTKIISIAFMFAGAAILIYLLYGSILFIVSRGDAKALQKAKNTIVYALLGGVVIILTFVIITVVTNILGLPPLIDNFSLYQGN